MNEKPHGPKGTDRGYHDFPMKVRMVMLGKTRRPELRALVDDYLGRVRRFATVEANELRQESALDRLKVEPTAAWVLLDAGGREFESEGAAV